MASASSGLRILLGTEWQPQTQMPRASPAPDPSNKPTFSERVIGAAAVMAIAAGVLLFVLTYALARGWVPGVSAPSFRDGVTLADLGSLVVAAATALLAGFTALLALMTSRSIAATRREAGIAEAALAVAKRDADISEQALETSWRPRLVDVPWGQYRVPDTIRGQYDLATVTVHRLDQSPATRVEIPLRNIGTGPAIIKGAGLSVDSDVGWSGASISRTIVAPDELTRIRFDVPHDRAELQPMLDALDKGNRTALIDVAYTDQVGTRTYRSQAHLHKSETSGWRVRQLALFDGDSKTPFAMSGPSDWDA
jgi:hypothetical protein